MILKILIIFTITSTFAYKPNKVPLPGRLYSWQCLHHNELIYSPRGCYILKMQDDGNLVAYHIQSGYRAVWSSGTNGSDGYRVCMQGDGNLVIEDRKFRPIWASGSHGNSGARLIMQDDGNVVIYGFASDSVKWVSNSAGRSC